MIIEALDLLRDLPYQMFFVGAGYAAEDMKQMVIARELEHKIFFKGSIYDREVLKAYYAAADLFLFPSLYDNAPLVVREAAALHTPAIITAGSTTSEIITDNFNGFLIQNTAIALAEKIRTIIQNKSLLSAVGDNASKTVAHSWENITNEVLDRYKHLIARKSNETAM
ncbi:MAG: glycosyltransferase [Paludibacteraceae bacterium]